MGVISEKLRLLELSSQQHLLVYLALGGGALFALGLVTCCFRLCFLPPLTAMWSVLRRSLAPVSKRTARQRFLLLSENGDPLFLPTAKTPRESDSSISEENTYRSSPMTDRSISSGGSS